MMKKLLFIVLLCAATPALANGAPGGGAPGTTASPGSGAPGTTSDPGTTSPQTSTNGPGTSSSPGADSIGQVYK